MKVSRSASGLIVASVLFTSLVQTSLAQGPCPDALDSAAPSSNAPAKITLLKRISSLDNEAIKRVIPFKIEGQPYAVDVSSKRLTKINLLTGQVDALFTSKDDASTIGLKSVLIHEVDSVPHAFFLEIESKDKDPDIGFGGTIHKIDLTTMKGSSIELLRKSGRAAQTYSHLVGPRLYKKNGKDYLFAFNPNFPGTEESFSIDIKTFKVTYASWEMFNHFRSSHAESFVGQSGNQKYILSSPNMSELQAGYSKSELLLRKFGNNRISESARVGLSLPSSSSLLPSNFSIHSVTPIHPNSGIFVASGYYPLPDESVFRPLAIIDAREAISSIMRSSRVKPGAIWPKAKVIFPAGDDYADTSVFGYRVTPLKNGNVAIVGREMKSSDSVRYLELNSEGDILKNTRLPIDTASMEVFEIGEDRYVLTRRKVFYSDQLTNLSTLKSHGEFPVNNMAGFELFEVNGKAAAVAWSHEGGDVYYLGLQ